MFFPSLVLMPRSSFSVQLVSHLFSSLALAALKQHHVFAFLWMSLGVGKSALALKYVRNEFSDALQTTVGACFFAKRMFVIPFLSLFFFYKPFCTLTKHSSRFLVVTALWTRTSSNCRSGIQQDRKGLVIFFFFEHLCMLLVVCDCFCCVSFSTQVPCADPSVLSWIRWCDPCV